LGFEIRGLGLFWVCNFLVEFLIDIKILARTFLGVDKNDILPFSILCGENMAQMLARYFACRVILKYTSE